VKAFVCEFAACALAIATGSLVWLALALGVVR